jgi:hypothetical protein
MSSANGAPVHNKLEPLISRWTAEIRRMKGYARDRSESSDLKWVAGFL